MPGLNEWRRTWEGLGVPAPDEPLRELTARYSEPHRKYHTLRHLDECFEKLREIRPEAERPAEIELALWFHDAIYEVRREDNEEKSARWAQSTALSNGLSTAVAGRVHALVMATRHDAVPDDRDQKALVDVDLSILGAPEARFDDYERQIRDEYSWVPTFVFRRTRRKILQQLLDRPRLFNTRTFFDTYEARARSNLERSIRALEA